MHPKRRAQGHAADQAVEIGIAVAAIAQPGRVVDQRPAAPQGFVIQVVLAVFPMVRDQCVGLRPQDVGDGQARLEAGQAMVDEIQAAGKTHEQRVFFQAHGVVDPQVFDEIGLRAVCGVAQQHGQVAGLDHAEIGFAHRQPPAVAPGPVVEVDFCPALCPQVADQAGGAPQVRHGADGCAQHVLVIRGAAVREGGQGPDGVVRRARSLHARRQAVDDAFDIDHVVVGDVHGDHPPAPGMKGAAPVGGELGTEFDDDVELLLRRGQVHHGGRRMGQQIPMGIGASGAVVHDPGLRHHGRGLQQHGQVKAVLENAVFPNRLRPVAQHEGDADPQVLSSHAAPLRWRGSSRAICWP